MHDESGARGVSVVVPVKGRVLELRDLLESVSVAARRCPEPVETIVVDDSPAPEAAQHQVNCRQYGARYVRGPRHVGAKRNVGIRLAAHDLVFFTDSDCRPEPDTIGRHVRTLRGAPATTAGVAGPTLVDASGTLLFRIMSRSGRLNGDQEKPLRNRRLTFATTSNLMVRRSALEEVGGFVEESLTVVAGEDVDLGLRLTGRGFVITCDPEARITHNRRSTDSLSTVTRRLFHYGRSEQWLCTVHPELRRVRLNPVTVLGAAAVAALAAPPRWRGRTRALVPAVGGLLVGREVARQRKPGDTPRTTAESVVRVLVDFSFDLGAAVAAVQLRRPALLLGGMRKLDDAPMTPEAPDGSAPRP
ncbi:hypothetical protein GCM10027168_09620 [Streptomyces capparidis]